MTFRGVQTLTHGAETVDAVYWNTALGLNDAFFASQPGGSTCRLETRATASRGPLTDALTPVGAVYPVIEVSVDLSVGDQVVCTQHPLGGLAPNDGVATTYAGTANSPGRVGFAGVARRALGGLVESFYVDACADCAAQATCDPGGEPVCVCAPGFFGDGETCAACPMPTHCAGGVSCSGPGDSVCSTCVAGYQVVSGACVDVDECIAELDNCHPLASCANSAGAFTCTCTPGTFGSGTQCTTCTAVSHCVSQITCSSASNSVCTQCELGYDLVEGACVLAAECDPHWSNVVLQMSFDSAIADESINTKSISLSSPAPTINTSNKKHGAGAADVNSARNYLVSGSPDFAFGTEDFTVEAWVYPRSYPAAGGWGNIIGSSGYGNTGGAGQWRFYINSNLRVYFYHYTTSNVGAYSAVLVQNNAWQHIAVTRQAGVIRLFHNGVLSTEGQTTSTQNLSAGTSGLSSNNVYPLDGLVDDVRITRGIARYTATFTPPGPLPTCATP